MRIHTFVCSTALDKLDGAQDGKCPCPNGKVRLMPGSKDPSFIPDSERLFQDSTKSCTVEGTPECPFSSFADSSGRPVKNACRTPQLGSVRQWKYAPVMLLKDRRIKYTSPEFRPLKCPVHSGKANFETNTCDWSKGKQTGVTTSKTSHGYYSSKTKENNGQLGSCQVGAAHHLGARQLRSRLPQCHRRTVRQPGVFRHERL